MTQCYPWEFYAIEALYENKREAVTLALVPRNISHDDREAWLKKHNVYKNPLDSPIALFVVAVTLH